MNKFSIIIPVRNEEYYLPKCLAAIDKSYKFLLKNISDCSLEIIVVINRSEDKSEEIANSAGCKVIYNNDKNLAKIRNDGAKAASGNIFITVDADSLMSENMLFNILQTLSNDRYIGGGVSIIPERYSLGIILTVLALLPLALYYRISCGLFFCSKESFWAIGGFDEKLCSVEDIDFAIRLKKFGKSKGKNYKTLFRSHIITSCRKFDKFGDWYFFKNPAKSIRLLKGRSQSDANDIWYDFKK